MNLNERYKELRGKTEQSMGRLVVVQQATNDRAAAGVDGGVVPTGGPVPVDEGDNQQWPPPPPGLPPQVHGQAHRQARQAEAVRNQSSSSRSDGSGGPQAWNPLSYPPSDGGDNGDSS
jgi:hypothetical protein